MKSLITKFTYDGFTFCQIARDGDIVLLEKSKAEHSQPCYEVIIVQVHAAQNIAGREYPERESMPRSEAWGTQAWSHANLDSATSRFRQLVAAREKAVSTPTPFPAGASRAVG